MLVLSRKQTQKIRLGDDIVITVLGVRGDQVRIGIEAPGHVTVLREELVASVEEANRAAAGVDVSALPTPATAVRLAVPKPTPPGVRT